VTTSTKIPLPRLTNDAQAGGFFPAEMKFAGYDTFIDLFSS
jgi:aldehyde:ferredoxin oxidoreductase